jgi:hypothetical protein
MLFDLGYEMKDLVVWKSRGGERHIAATLPMRRCNKQAKLTILTRGQPHDKTTFATPSSVAENPQPYPRGVR